SAAAATTPSTPRSSTRCTTATRTAPSPRCAAICTRSPTTCSDGTEGSVALLTSPSNILFDGSTAARCRDLAPVPSVGLGSGCQRGRPGTAEQERAMVFRIQPHVRLHEWVADERGFFAEEGLDYEFDRGFAAGSAPGVSADVSTADTAPLQVPLQVRSGA